jgi:crotonobetainyl-CoA:carnitine CoA-transferase CaiB-like acyl-CoA transferase
VTSLYGALGTVAAIYQRHLTDKGQWVDVGLMDCLVSFEGPFLARYGMVGEVEKRVGCRSYFGAPNNIYKTKDGYVTIVANADYMYQRVCRAMGREDLIDDPRFKTRTNRLKNIDELDATVGGWMAMRTTSDVCKLLEEHEVPFGPVQDMAQLYNDSQVKAREMVMKVEHPTIGHVPVVGSAMKLSGSRFETPSPAPTLGQHNEEVYSGLLGFTKEELALLKTEGVI